MNISFARHGETAWNAEGRLMGSRFDEVLSEKGHSQAQELARAVRTDFEVLIATPLKRALQTAEYVKVLYKLPLEIYPEFSEFDAGLVSGMKFENLDAFTQGKLTLEKIQKGQVMGFEEFGGESTEDVTKRVLKGLERLKNSYAGKKVLVVTHVGILRILYRIAGKNVPDNIPNASVVELEL